MNQKDDDFSIALRRIEERFIGDDGIAVRADLARIRAAGIDSVDTLESIIKNGDTPQETRLAGCWLLARLMPPSAPATFFTLFSSPIPELRAAGTRYFAEVKGSGHDEEIIQLLRTDQDREVRFAAAYALGLIGRDSAISSILEAAQDTREETRVRGAAIEALADIRNPRVIQDLIPLLKDPASEVRFWTIFTLGQLGDASIIADLEHLRDTDEAVVPGWRSIREECDEAIRNIHERSNSTAF